MAERTVPSQELLHTMKEWSAITREAEMMQSFHIGELFNGLHEVYGDPAFPIRLELQTKYADRLYKRVSNDLFLRQAHYMSVFDSPVYNGPKLSYVLEVPANNVSRLRMRDRTVEKDVDAYGVTLYESGLLEGIHQRRVVNIDDYEREVREHSVISRVRTSDLSYTSIAQIIAIVAPHGALKQRSLK